MDLTSKPGEVRQVDHRSLAHALPEVRDERLLLGAIHLYALRYRFGSMRDARTHGAGDRHALHVRALGRGRLGPNDLVHERAQVLGEPLQGERHLADGRMHVPGLVHPELDLTGLDLLHGPADVQGDRAGLGCGHESARTEYAAQGTHLAHEVGRRHGDVEVEPPFLDLVDEFHAHEVGSGVGGLLGLVALCDDQDANGLSCPVRQDHRSADDLIGLTRIDAQTGGNLHRLVELREGELLDELHRLVGSELDAYRHRRAGGGEALACCWHPFFEPSRSPPTAGGSQSVVCGWSLVLLNHLGLRYYASTSTPIERAVPATIFIAASTSLALRSGIFVSAIWRS